MDVPVSAANAAGRPVERVQDKKIRAYGTVNQAVDIVAPPEDAENLKKLLSGISGYQNPLRRGTFQVDYRYYAEARRRLQAAGYEIEETDFMGRELSTWSPQTRDYRYYAEARRRLQAAGYEIEETDFMGRELSTWSPQTRGWTKVEGA